MSTQDRSNATRAGLVVALVSTVVLTVTLSGATSVSDRGPVVSAAELHTIFESRPDAAGVEHDALEFFEGRRIERGDEPLTLRRLAGIHLLRFRAYGQMDELEPVREVTELLTQRYAGDPSAHSLRASLALSTHDFPTAVEASRRYRETSDIGSDEGAFRLFDALWATGDYEGAVELLKDTDDEIRSIGRLSREARMVDGMGDVDEARHRMERVVELVDAYAEPRTVRAWARVELGAFLAHSGNPRDAVARFQEALDLIPGYPAALEGLGWMAYGFDEDLHVAQKLFEQSLANGGHLDTQLTLAEVVRARGDAARADSLRADFLTRATVDEMTERMHYRPLALTLAEDPSTLDRALGYAERDLELRGDRMTHAVHGLILSRLGQTDKAVAAAEKALAWGSPEPAVLHLAGEVFLEAGYTRRGVRLLRDALDGRTELGPVVAAEIEGARARS